MFVSITKPISGRNILKHIVIVVEEKCASEHSDSNGTSAAKAGDCGKLGILQRNKDASDTDGGKNKHSKVDSDGNSKTNDSGALTMADERESNTCKTCSTYIQGMGYGWFAFATLLTFIAYARWVWLF